jgi:putative glycerol-1-phosphate prenyltransferase
MMKNFTFTFNMESETSLYNYIVSAKQGNRKLLAILLDPDKIDWPNLNHLISKIKASPATHLLIGGSQVFSDKIDELVVGLKSECQLPVILFPGNPSQISLLADGILFLSLLSGRNADFLIGHQTKAAPLLKASNLEIIPTGYILIESGSETAVAKISQTAPMPIDKPDEILHTAQAGEMLGKKMIYLEAGSGAQNPVPLEIVSLVSKNMGIPLIVGGGIRSQLGIQNAFDAGADMVVIGTAFENDLNFFDR